MVGPVRLTLFVSQRIIR